MAARVRVEKVQEAIQHEISNMLLFDVKDSRIHDITVTEVKVSDDMSHAKIYVSLYGSEESKEETWKALIKSLGYFRSEIAKRIRLRYTPELHFIKDETAEYSAHIEELLAKIKRDENNGKTNA